MSKIWLYAILYSSSSCNYCGQLQTRADFVISANILTHSSISTYSSIGTYSDVDLFSFLFSVDSYFFVDYLHQEVLMKSKVFAMRSWQFVMLKPAEALTSHATLTDRSHEEDTGIRANSSKKKKKNAVKQRLSSWWHSVDAIWWTRSENSRFTLYLIPNTANKRKCDKALTQCTKYFMYIFK